MCNTQVFGGVEAQTPSIELDGETLQSSTIIIVKISSNLSAIHHSDTLCRHLEEKEKKPCPAS